jgi:hypothetical protein
MQVRTASFCQPFASSVRLICVPIGPVAEGVRPVFGLSVMVHEPAAIGVAANATEMSPVTCVVSVKRVMVKTPSPLTIWRPTSDGWNAAAVAVATRAAPTVIAESASCVFGWIPTSSCASTKKEKFCSFHAA